MNNIIISVIMLGVCLLIYASYILYNKIILPRRKVKEESARKMSTNIWTNVVDIDDAILTRDGYAISVYQITPVNVDLMTKKEKSDFVKEISGCVSSIKTPYKFLAVPQPFDVQPYLDTLQEQKRTSSDIQKLIIANEINYINSMVITGTMVEKHFYLLTWEHKEDDYRKSCEDFIRHWNESRRIEIKILNQSELIQLCNLIFNPSVTDEKYETEAVLPIIL